MKNWKMLLTAYLTRSYPHTFHAEVNCELRLSERIKTVGAIATVGRHRRQHRRPVVVVPATVVSLCAGAPCCARNLSGT